MRISFVLLIFLVLFNGWAGLLQDHGVDEHLGISAETGDPEELQRAQESAREFQTGGSVGGTLLGYYNSLTNAVKDIVTGIQPGVQMLVNVVSNPVGEDLIVWGFSILPFLIAADLLAYGRGVDL